MPDEIFEGEALDESALRVEPQDRIRRRLNYWIVGDDVSSVVRYEHELLEATERPCRIIVALRIESANGIFLAKCSDSRRSSSMKPELVFACRNRRDHDERVTSVG